MRPYFSLAFISKSQFATDTLGHCFERLDVYIVLNIYGMYFTLSAFALFFMNCCYMEISSQSTVIKRQDMCRSTNTHAHITTQTHTYNRLPCTFCLSNSLTKNLEVPKCTSYHYSYNSAKPHTSLHIHSNIYVHAHAIIHINRYSCFSA